MSPDVKEYLFSLSILDAIKTLKPSPKVRVQLIKKCGQLDWREFVIPLSLVFRELTAGVKEELMDLAERKLYHDSQS